MVPWKLALWVPPFQESTSGVPLCGTLDDNCNEVLLGLPFISVLDERLGARYHAHLIGVGRQRCPNLVPWGQSLIDGLLQRIKESGAIGRIVNAGAAELANVGGDKLFEAIEANATTYVRGFAMKTREDLISALAGPMPASFGERLRARGYEISDEQAQTLWRDCLAAIADQPAGAAA